MTVTLKGPTVLVIALTSCMLCLAGPVEITQTGEALTLGNGLAEYTLDPATGYCLSGARLVPQDLPAPLSAAQFLYEEEGRWVYESGAPIPELESDRFAQDDLQIEGDAGRMTVRVIRHNSRFRLAKSFTLSADDPVLDLAFEVTPIADHAAGWGYTTMVWLGTAERRWLHPRNEVRGGRVVQAVAGGLPSGGKVGNRPWTLLPDPWVGCVNAETGAGLIVLKGADEMLPLRAGEQGAQAFVGLRASNFPAFEAGAARQRTLAGKLALLPFVGEPDEALEAALRAHGRADLGPQFPRKAQSGAVLQRGEGLTLWWDLPTSKVFRDEPLPPDTADGVRIHAARGEYEPFQLVLRPDEALEAVRLECPSLTGPGGEIGEVTWHALEYYRSEEQVQPTGFVGEVPDTLLAARQIDCAAGVNQPLWVTVRVPRDAAPGDYTGAVRVMAGDRQIAEAPVELHVWDFALPEERSLAVWCPVWEGNLRQHYGREQTAELLPAYLQNVAEHRAGQQRMSANPVIEWDEEGNVTRADFAAFDAALEELVERDRLPIITLPVFTIGYGHIPRDNRFGKADEILTPLWRKKCEGYARALARHLEKRGLNDRMVMSLFDEPHAEYFPMIREVIELLRGVEPRWRYTYWGAYAPQLEGAVDVWTIPMSHYAPSLAERIRARGEEVWVYNPPAYYIDDTAMSVRTVYWWAWRHEIPLVYQWTITAWIEWTGSETLWDPHRNASWVLPGEDGPLNTVRFELTREGLEDYEYLALLKGLVVDADGELVRRARSLLARAEAMAWTSDDEKIAFLHSHDQVALHDLRREIGECVEAMAR